MKRRTFFSLSVATPALLALDMSAHKTGSADCSRCGNAAHSGLCMSAKGEPHVQV